MSARPDHDAHVLAGRLNAGWVMIEAETDPTKKARLENHWTELLRQYQEACDQAPMDADRQPDGRFAVEVAP